MVDYEMGVICESLKNIKICLPLAVLIMEDIIY